MLYLILAICASTLVSVFMRLGSRGEAARHPMLAVNYLVCTAVSAAFLEGVPAPGTPGTGFALGLGLLGGALFLGAFLLLQWNVRENGVTLSSAFMKLGVLVPTLLGFTLFREALTLPRALGILLTLAAIPLLGGGYDGGGRKRLAPLVLLMLGGGLADGLSKFFEAYGNPALKGGYLLCVFGFALVLCALLCGFERQRPTLRDWGFGALLGVPNYFSTRFLLLALSDVPASVAYPAFSCGAILLTALIGRLAFGERQDRRQLAGLALVLAALTLLNI